MTVSDMVATGVDHPFRVDGSVRWWTEVRVDADGRMVTLCGTETKSKSGRPRATRRYVRCDTEVVEVDQAMDLRMAESTAAGIRRVHPFPEDRARLFRDWVRYHRAYRLEGVVEYRASAWGCVRQANIRVRVPEGEPLNRPFDDATGPPAGSLVLYDEDEADSYYRWMRDSLGIVSEE